MSTKYKTIARLIGSILLTTLVAGCSVTYYWQAGFGHMRIVGGKQSVQTLLAGVKLSTDERQQLELSQVALEFAHETMLLPDNGSYRSYYDTGRSYAVWNVFAAPEFELEPLVWCFPVAGCIAYRGYFKEESARKYAAQLAAEGDDVFVGGVTAYSTLGRFRDPLLNTMLDLPEAEFVGLLLHELAHQRLYVKDDSAFNEGFATAVENEGVRRWRMRSQVAGDSQANEGFRQQVNQVLQLLRDARDRLKELYASDLGADTMRVRKAEMLAGLTTSYDELAEQWARAGLARRPYSRLFALGFNNASLSAIATYDDYVPAFEAILQQCDFELECFYVEVDQIAALDAEQRDIRLRSMLD